MADDALACNRRHIERFRCITCDTLLDTDEKVLPLSDGSFTCGSCTYKCYACGNKIMDSAIFAGDWAYCASCFRCRNCLKKISDLRYARTSLGICCQECVQSLMPDSTALASAVVSLKPKAASDPKIPATVPVDGRARLGPNLRLLLVDVARSHIRVIAQAYLDFLRVLAANTGGPWIFHTVQSACLAIKGYNESFNTEEPDKLSSKGLGRASFSGFEWCTCNEYPHEEKVYECNEEHVCECDEFPHEDNVIIDAVNRSKSWHLDGLFRPSELWSFDYILVWNRLHIPPLKKILRLGQDIKSNPAKARIVFLPKVALTLFSRPEQLISPVCASIRGFLETLDWKHPRRSISAGPFRTLFVPIALNRALLDPGIEECFDRAGRESDCKLYMSGHPCAPHELIVAFVGAIDDLSKAVSFVDLLKRHDLGHVKKSLKFYDNDDDY